MTETIIESAVLRWIDEIGDEALVQVAERVVERLAASCARTDPPSSARGFMLTVTASGRLHYLYERRGHAALGSTTEDAVSQYYASDVVIRRKFI